ncbi:MAG: diaminopimelate epimerase [Candidatus Hydrogenedentota bacterium]|nr:MAG: diaminopimelate epimerase [Candidatus Hydrogenedentota bacterium]
MNFLKMHGIGNDYVFLREEELRGAGIPEAEFGEAAVRLADRHTGIGGDGLILVGESETAAARMRIFNADGSEAEMCGNGIRCVASWLFREGRIGERGVIETGAGPITVEVIGERSRGHDVRVDMGRPIFTPEKIPADLPAKTVALGGEEVEAIVAEPIAVGSERFEVTCVSMGNPHAVIFVPDVDSFPVPEWGPRIEHHPVFPARVNVEFVQVLAPGHLKQRTWERGSGETYACGTGASAVFAAAVLCGIAEKEARIHLRGGELIISWDGEGDLFMTGPAEESFRGTFDPSLLKEPEKDS